MSDNKKRYEKLLIDVNKLIGTINTVQAGVDNVYSEYVRLQTNGRSDTIEYKATKQLLESLHKISIDTVRESLTVLARKINAEVNPVDVRAALDEIDDSQFFKEIH